MYLSFDIVTDMCIYIYLDLPSYSFFLVEYVVAWKLGKRPEKMVVYQIVCFFFNRLLFDQSWIIGP